MTVVALGAFFVVVEPLDAADDVRPVLLSSVGVEVSGGRTYAGVVAAAAVPVNAPLAVIGVLPVPCLGALGAEDRLGPQRNQLLVTASHCAVLGRMPDAAELDDWTDQLAAGLSAVDLIEALSASPELEADQVGGIRQFLRGLTLLPGSEADIEPGSNDPVSYTHLTLPTTPYV